MLSLFSTWIVEGFWEKVLVPAVGWLIRGAVDLDKVNDISQIDAFANGQCIAMQRAAYFTIKGTNPFAIRYSKMFGLLGPSTGRHGSSVRPTQAFRVRLYRSLSGVNGYTKLYEGSDGVQ